ncbi:MAG: hypothetical protein SCK28_06995 [Bacillota bacterium]|nr:hypothetical protein [Bacillota bacterium]
MVIRKEKGQVNKFKIWQLIIIVMIAIPLIASYTHYRSIKIDNDYEYKFIASLSATIAEKSSFNLQEVTPFDWDKMLMIPPYTSKTEIQKIVGQEWTIYNTYLGYLFEKTIFGEHPLDDDIFHKLIFIKDDEIIVDVTLMRTTADFTQLQGEVLPQDDLLKVMEKEYGGFVISR